MRTRIAPCFAPASLFSPVVMHDNIISRFNRRNKAWQTHYTDLIGFDKGPFQRFHPIPSDLSSGLLVVTISPDNFTVPRDSQQWYYSWQRMCQQTCEANVVGSDTACLFDFSSLYKHDPTCSMHIQTHLQLQRLWIANRKTPQLPQNLLKALGFLLLEGTVPYYPGNLRVPPPPTLPGNRASLTVCLFRP